MGIASSTSGFPSGGGVEGLLAAVSYVHEALSPIAASFPPLSPEAAGKVRLIELPRHGEQKVREPSSKEKFQRMWENISGDPVLYIAVVAVLLGSGISWLYFYFRQCGKLLDTPTDYRLASPYGASVSRYVRYLEGKEAAREKKYSLMYQLRKCALLKNRSHLSRKLEIFSEPYFPKANF